MGGLMIASPVHAQLYSVTNLGTLGGSTVQSYAWGINDSGTIVGNSVNVSGADHAFSYSGGGMTDLGNLPGGGLSGAFAINASGVIVGNSTSSGSQDAFRYSGGTMIDLGTL